MTLTLRVLRRMQVVNEPQKHVRIWVENARTGRNDSRCGRDRVPYLGRKAYHTWT